MAKNKNGDKPKQITYVRIPPDMIAALDAIAESMTIKPTRAQLINVAVSEYVERHGRKRAGADH